jgi:hypothetical protein
MNLSTSIAAATLAVAPAVVVPAPTAHAALPTCDSSMFQHVANGWYIDNPGMFDTLNHRCLLRYGDRFRDPEHSPVMTLQRNLNYCYRTGLAVDGVYGPRTRAAVQRVQRLHGITDDGVYGPQTRSAMRWREYSFDLGRWSQRCYSPF